MKRTLPPQLLAVFAISAALCAGRQSAGTLEAAAVHPVAQAQTAVIRVDSSLVMVPVSVTDTSGRTVRDLRLEDFYLEENGRPESIVRVADADQTAMELALVLDVSRSVMSRFEFERQAAARFLKSVWRPGDTLTIHTIGPEPSLIQPRTTDVARVLEGLSALEPGADSTAFFDTLACAARLLRATAAPQSRRVLVVLSDGEDNHSEGYQLGQVLRELQRAECVFYSINPGGPSIRLNKMSLAGQNGMQQLAAHTGGSAFLPNQRDELETIFGRIASEVRAQYLLEYYPSNHRCDGGYRPIAVRIRNRPELRVHSRLGYYTSDR